MPPKSGKSNLAAKLGSKLTKAIAAHKSDETRYDNTGSLPPGIEGGIAQLTSCTIGQFKKGDNAGEYFFMAQGTVARPAEFEGQRLEGRTTKIGPEPICDTKTKSGQGRQSLDEHVDWILNHMRMLGLDTSEFEDHDLEGMAAALEEAAPYFRFRTWQGKATQQYPNPRVNETWQGQCEYTEGDEDTVGDKTADDGDDDSGSKKTATASWDDDDLDEMAKAADNKDDPDADAAERLAEIAKGLDIDSDEMPTWKATVKAIRAAQESAGEFEEEDDSNGVPVKGSMWWHKPKGAKKRIEYEVVAVFPKTETANLKNLDDNKIVKAVPFDEMQPTN